MAKVQTFADKLKKKQQEEAGIMVKVIKGFRTEKGSVAYNEKLVNVKDASQIDNIEI